MNSIMINEKIIKSIVCADDVFIDNIKAEINAIVDKELLKSDAEMNTELIGACIDAVLFLENIGDSGSDAELFGKITEKANSLGEINRRKRTLKAGSYVAAAAAAVIIVTAFIPGSNDKSILSNVANKVMEGFFGGNVETTSPLLTTENESTTEATAKTSVISSSEVQNTSQGYTSEDTTASKSESKVSVSTVKQLYGEFSDDFVIEFESADKISLKGLVVKVVYDDNSETVVALSECGVSYSSPDSKNRVRVTVSYNNKYFSFYVRVVPKEVKNPVVLNSIYGEFDGAYSVDKMTVYAVYSDGTKKVIPSSEYKIKREYDEDFGGVRVVVSYGGCDFGFMEDE